MTTFSRLLLLLAWHSFLGWVDEVLSVLRTSERLQNRGFLTGPFVPIHWFGAVFILQLVAPAVQRLRSAAEPAGLICSQNSLLLER